MGATMQQKLGAMFSELKRVCDENDNYYNLIRHMMTMIEIVIDKTCGACDLQENCDYNIKCDTVIMLDNLITKAKKELGLDF